MINPTENKLVYEVEKYDTNKQQLESNIICENMLSQVDSEGNNYQALTESIDYNRYGRINTREIFLIKSSNVIPHFKKITHGCKSSI